MTEPDTLLHEGSGNIFADLDLPGAASHLLKAQIVAELYRLTTELNLTQAKVGQRLALSQPEVSRLFKGHFREYSVERLMTLLTRFDRDIEIVSHPRAVSDGQGQITFTVATDAG